MNATLFPIAAALQAKRRRRRAYLNGNTKRRMCQFVRSYCTMDLRGAL